MCSYIFMGIMEKPCIELMVDQLRWRTSFRKGTCVKRTPPRTTLLRKRQAVARLRVAGRQEEKCVRPFGIIITYMLTFDFPIQFLPRGAGVTYQIRCFIYYLRGEDALEMDQDLSWGCATRVGSRYQSSHLRLLIRPGRTCYKAILMRNY